MDSQTNELIKNEIKSNEVCLFMKGTPDAPQCGFSMAVTNILKMLEVNFKGVNVLADQKCCNLLQVSFLQYTFAMHTHSDVSVVVVIGFQDLASKLFTCFHV